MAGFDHAHAPPKMEPDPPSNVRSARYGYVLFVFYLVVYGAYVLLNAFAPAVMAKTPWGGINLAVVSGLALIVIAFLLALIYDWLCRLVDEPESEIEAPKDGEAQA